MTDTPENTESLHKFPCDFTIKVFGLANDEFEGTVLAIIKKHVPILRENALQTRSSEQGKYVALNITIHAESKAQLDKIYMDLTANPLVLMAL